MTPSEDPRYPAALEDVAAERWRNRRRNGVLMLMWAMITLVVPLALWGAYSNALTATGAMFIHTRNRGRRLVLWLRPFHKAESHPHRFGRALLGASAHLGLPLTIQDSVFQRSFTWALNRAFPWFPVATWVFVVPIALVLFFPDAWFSVLFESAGSSKSLLVFGWALACVLGYCLLVVRAGVTRLSDAKAIQSATSLLFQMKQQKGWLNGVILLQCGDSCWQDVVAKALTVADVVVIDVSHLSDNVIWELREALRVVGPRSMMLAYHSADRQPLFPPSLERRLSELAGDEILECERCVYPAPKLAKSLRASITRCLAANRLHPRWHGPAPKKTYEVALTLAKAKFHKQYGDQYGSKNDAFFDFRAAELALDTAFLEGAPLDIDRLSHAAAEVDRKVPRAVIEDFVDSIRAEC